MSRILDFIKQDLLLVPSITTDTELIKSQDPYTTIEFAKQILTPTDLSSKPLMFAKSQNSDWNNKTKSPSKSQSISNLAFYSEF